MGTFLPPIEKPKGLIMKLAFYFIHRQFGKVFTPLKVAAESPFSALANRVFSLLWKSQSVG